VVEVPGEAFVLAAVAALGRVAYLDFDRWLDHRERRRKYMRVGVQGDADRGMSKPAADDLGVDPPARQAGKRVTERQYDDQGRPPSAAT
jgi:hypothetical protein